MAINSWYNWSFTACSFERNKVLFCFIGHFIKDLTSLQRLSKLGTMLLKAINLESLNLLEISRKEFCFFMYRRYIAVFLLGETHGWSPISSGASYLSYCIFIFKYSSSYHVTHMYRWKWYQPFSKRGDGQYHRSPKAWDVYL